METFDIRHDLISITELRTKTTATLRRAEHRHGFVVLDRKGWATGVLMSVDRYMHMEARIRRLEETVDALIDLHNSKDKPADDGEAIEQLERQIRRSQPASQKRLSKSQL